jgi:hypothetical protein
MIAASRRNTPPPTFGLVMIGLLVVACAVS